MKHILTAFFLLLAPMCQFALAVPDSVSVRVTDVTTTSLSVVWMTDVQAEPAVEIYTDGAMISRVTEGITVTSMPDASPEVSTAAKAKGILKARISGLAPASTYYVRSVTRDPANADSVGYSSLIELKTASVVAPYAADQDGSLKGFANDLTTMKVYIRPNDQQSTPGMGDLLMLETSEAAYPVTAFVGAGVSAPEGVIDLNNLFGTNLSTLWVKGGDKCQIRFYRGGSLATMLHYRRLPVNSGILSANDPVKGYFADINLDGKVDDGDFEEFRKQYRTSPNDGTYNPDFKFVQTDAGNIGAEDFTRFAREYGRVDVPQQ